jgi:N-methylhydantoinase B
VLDMIRANVRMLEDYGLDDLDHLADEIIGRSERSMRASIAQTPSGVYHSEGVIEQMAGQPDVRIHCALTIAGGNVVHNFTYAYVHMAVKSVFDPDIPNNDGVAAPIRLIAPEGTVVNCRFPAAVAARMQIGHFITEVIYRALARALPGRVVAASGGTPATMLMFYGRRNDGQPFHAVLIRGGGYGEPRERDREALARDIREGRISVESARRDYGSG